MAAARSPTYAIMGDLTFLHDSNGLVIGPDEPRPDLCIVVLNDDGGGIFALLEQGAPEHAGVFERVFGTPHGTDLAALCAATGRRTRWWQAWRSWRLHCSPSGQGCASSRWGSIGADIGTCIGRLRRGVAEALLVSPRSAAVSWRGRRAWGPAWRRFRQLGLGVGTGDDAATGEQPQPGRVVGSISAQRRAMPHFAVAGRVDPADRAGVAAPVQSFDLADEPRRPCRRTAHAAVGCNAAASASELDESAATPVTSVARCITFARSRTNGVSGDVHARAECGAARRRPIEPRTRAPPGPCSDCASEAASARSCASSPVRRIVPARTRDVTSPRSSRTRSSGVAPSRPSTQNVQHRG